MKIAILYICTGNYNIFWKEFYKSCEENFLQKSYKKYFVFTDSLDICSGNNVEVIPEKPKGFPLDSLLRFKMFNSISEKLQEFDFIFFFNSNMKFVQNVDENFLPNINEPGLVGVLHPGYYNVSSKYYPYDRNKESKAFIKFSQEKKFKYYMGGMNGGRKAEFLKLIDTLEKDIDYNISKNIVPIYHDETHLNFYFNNTEVKTLDPSYGFPEDSKIPFVPKIVILNKIKHGGKFFDKLPKSSIIKRFELKIKTLYRAFMWKYL